MATTYLTDRIMAVFGQINTPVRIDVGRAALGLVLGATVCVQHPRIRDGQVWYGRIVDIDIAEASGKYDIYVWGNIPAPD